MADIENALSEWLDGRFAEVASDNGYIDRDGVGEIVEEAMDEYMRYGSGSELLTQSASDSFDDSLRSTLEDYNNINMGNHCITGNAFTDAVRKAMSTSDSNATYGALLDELMVRMKKVERTMTTVKYAFLATEREQQKMADQIESGIVVSA